MKVRWTFRPEECPSRCEKKKSIKIEEIRRISSFHYLIYGFRSFLRLFIVISDFFGFTKCDSPYESKTLSKDCKCKWVAAM